MTDEQKVFIRGVEGRGDEVSQTLINLGGKNVHDFCYDDTEGLFFINHNREIRYASEFSEMGKIIMDCYTELHLPEKKKLTDWRWKPKYDERYYHIISDGTVHSCAWLNDEIDSSRFNIGNCFKTEKEANGMAEKIKKLLKGE